MSETPETSTQTTVVATQDASIVENRSTNGNWSKNEVYGGSTPVIALVEFDLSSFSVNDNVQTATFRPYVRTLKNDQPSTFSIYSTAPKDWSQSSVQWSTRPLKDQFLDTVTITADESYVEFDVTNAVQAAIDNGQSKVTFWIEDSEEDYEGFEFDSVNKNPSYPNEPELVIVSGVAETDTTAPTFSSAATSTDGIKVILTYNESLSSTTASASDFLVEVDGVTAIISGVAISGSTVELTLGSAISSGQSVTVAFTDPTSNNDSNAIQDTSGNDAATLSTTTVSNQVAEVGQGLLQILGSTVNDKDWNENVGGGHLRADLSQLSDRDISEAIEYQWYADDIAVSGATSRDLKLEAHNISTEAIHLIATYTTLSGQQRIATSPTLNQLDWRIFSGGEDSSIAGDYPYTGIMESNLVGDNPTPFMATYSFASSSRTHGGNGWYEDGYRASETHSITSINASDQGLPTQEGINILKIAATSDSKRVEWGNRNFNTRVQENQNVYVSQKIYLPSSEWDEVTQYSTIIYQHKQYPGSDPNFEIRLSNLGDYKLYVRSPYSHYGLTGQKVTDYPIATLSPDTWHDFKIHLTPSQSNSVGQMAIYLDGEIIFSEQGTNLNDIDTTNDSFLKLGMYTQILDDRHYFVDAVEMATFLPSTVSDWVNGTTTDTTAPTFQSAATSTDGTKVILTYNEALSSTTAAASDFTIEVDGSDATISNVATSGTTVELTLSSAVAYGQTVTVAYTDPTSGNDSHAIQDAAGNDADNLSATAVANNVPQAGTNNFVQLLGSNNQSTNNDQFDGCLYAEIGNIKDLDTSKAIQYQWYA
ncbi:MAG: heparin lyase I family protein, partial [Akkermansiaceae bacterium]|nr:heparin lyase I family protein [Akkermansiaceae bacterium]